MYNLDNPYMEERYGNRSRRIHKDTPSFSSTLLDEIYRSIDGGGEKSEDYKAHRGKAAKKQGGGGYRTKTNIIEDEGRASVRRVCLVEKWVQNEKNEKYASKGSNRNLEMENNGDLVFFSSTSSSNSDSSGALSSSDTEFFASQTEPKVSCFSTRPKPIRTGLPSRESRKDDYSPFGEAKKTMREDDLTKHKCRALKLYSNLKKVKQPISPGGRLTSFINSIFSNANGKKSKNADPDNKTFRDLKPAREEALSACSSAASFSRSCLSKYSPASREKMRGGAALRTVRFHPVSVIVDEDSRPCGEKCTYGEGSDGYGYGKPPLMGLKLGKLENNRKVEGGERNERKGYSSNKKTDDYSAISKINYNNRDYEDDEDGISDSSSDLFELDHLALFGNNRFCEELPVYETTHLDTNCVIAGHLIR